MRRDSKLEPFIVDVESVHGGYSGILVKERDGSVLSLPDALMRRFLSVCDHGRMGEFSRNWGYRYTDEYRQKMLRWRQTLRDLAKSIDIYYMDGRFWCFTGRIYERVSEKVLYEAYSLFVESLGVVAVMGNKTLFQDCFLQPVQIYNPLMPSFGLVAFQNGVLDLGDMSLHDFSPKYHVTYMHPFRYDPKARCVKWQSFLREVLPDKSSRMILQMFLGLGLIERGSVYKRVEGSDKVELCLLLVGAGSNGKSVIYETATGVYGCGRISGVSYDELTAPGDEGMRARRLIRDKVFNWVSDADSRTFGRRTGVFKKIVSGEPVTDRAIGEDVRENDRIPYLVFNINELPNPEDASLGFIRRLQFVSFDVVIPPERQNKALSFELIKEYPGIFNWLVRGARELRRRKFVFPSCERGRRRLIRVMANTSSTLAWTRALGLRESPVTKGELCVYIHTSDLWGSYTKFCVDNDLERDSQTRFGRKLSELGYLKSRRSEGWYYRVYGCPVKALMRTCVIDDLLGECDDGGEWDETSEISEED